MSTCMDRRHQLAHDAKYIVLYVKVDHFIRSQLASHVVAQLQASICKLLENYWTPT